MILLAIFFLNSVVNAFIGVNVYYAQYIMNDDSLVGNLSIFQNIASFAAFAICTGIIRKIGKQKIAISGVAISFIGYAMVLLNPTSYAVLYIAAIIKGVGNAALSGVMYGMLADTVEYNDWKSGIRAEGLVFSANSIGQKIGSGIGSTASFRNQRNPRHLLICTACCVRDHVHHPVILQAGQRVWTYCRRPGEAC